MAPKSLCLTTALAPVPAFLGGSCPLGCSLSAPATGGFSVVSPSALCMRQAPRREGGRRPTSWGYYSTMFVFCKGSGAFWAGADSGVRSAEGLAWAPPPAFTALQWLGGRRCPTGPPSYVFGNRGTPPVPPAGAAPPAPRWGNGVVFSPGASGRFLTRGRERMLSSLPPPSTGGKRAAPGPKEALLSSPGGESGLTPAP